VNQEVRSCDLCKGVNGRIHDACGYAFYSSKQKEGIKEGLILLCDRCTSGIVLRLEDGRLSESNPLYGLFAPEYGESDLKWRPLQFAAMNSIDGIVERCRFHGLSPEGAKSKARELAEECRADPAQGPAIAGAFWDRIPPRPLLTAVISSGRREGSRFRYQIKMEAVNEGNLAATFAGLTIHFIDLTSREQLVSCDIAALADGATKPLQFAPGDLLWGFFEDRSWGQKPARCLMVESVVQNWKPGHQMSLEICLTLDLQRLDAAVRVWASSRTASGDDVSDGDPSWSTEAGRDQQGIPCYPLTIGFKT
jgi:hypothetical protein